MKIPAALVSLAVAVLLTLFALPEVVLLGGSLSNVGLNDVVGGAPADDVVLLYPDLEDRDPRDGLIDVGARAWQLDPATKFVERSFDAGDSVAWNPYSAGGMVGPETLADMKLSPLVVVTAALGASSFAFTLVVLAGLLLALYCLQQLFVRTLAASRLAAVMACVVFLIGGWAAAMLGSQMGAPYFLFPVVLYTLAEFLRSVGPVRLVVAVAAYASLLLTTFVPVVLLMVILVHTVSIVIDASTWDVDDGRPILSRAAGLLGRQAMIPACALATTAVVWLPALDAYRNGGADIGRYGSRVLEGREPLEYLSVVTPRHIYRSYLPSTVPAALRESSAIVYLGIVPILAMVGALPRARGLARRLLVVTGVVVVLAVAQHVAVPVLDVIGGLPILRSISSVYWAALAAGALTIGAGLAVETAVRAGLSWQPVLAVGLVIVTAFAVAVTTNWRPSGVALASIAAGVLLVAVVTALSWFAHGQERRRMIVAVLLVAVGAAELWSYANHSKVARFDFEDDPPDYVAFLEANLGEYRVLNAGRSALYPEWGAAFGIREVGTLNVMQDPEYRAFYQRYVNPEERGLFLQLGADESVEFASAPAALDQMSVKYIVVADELSAFTERVAREHPQVFEDEQAGVRVFENEDAFPRTYVSQSLVPERQVAGEQPRWRTDRAFTQDPSLLAAAEAGGVRSDPTVGDRDPGAAQLVDDRNTQVRVEVETNDPGLLVLTDVFHDNWSASVNGQPAVLGRVNDVVRGVVVPAGQSVVEFEYQSPERTVGFVISLVSGVVLLVSAAGWAVVRRRRAASPAVGVGQRETTPVG